MKVSIQLEMPRTVREELRKSPCKSVEDRVREAIELIESGHDSRVEWHMLVGLYRQLASRKKTERVRNLMSMIKPTLEKYGYYGSVTDGR